MVFIWQRSGVPMGIRIPGSKSRTHRFQQSDPAVGPPEEVLGVEDVSQLDDRLDTHQLPQVSEVEIPVSIDRVESTRASRAWIRIFPALVLLAVILVFVFQNLDNTKIVFMMFSGTIPAALALFIAAALGGLLVLMIGSIRIIQLRKVIHGRVDSRTTDVKSQR